MVTAGFIFAKILAWQKSFILNQINSIKYINTTVLFKYEICYQKPAKFLSKYFLKLHSIVIQLIHQLLHMNTSHVL